MQAARLPQGTEESGPERETAPAAVDLHIPTATILKVLFTVVVVWAVLKAAPILLMLVVALLAAVTLAPAAARLERLGLSRGGAVAILATLLLVAIVLFVFLVLPPLVSQTMELVDHLHTYRADVEARLLPEYPILARIATQILDLPSSPEVASSLKRPMAWGRLAVEVFLESSLMFVLALYLLMDGKTTYAWLLAYVPRRHRGKMARTLPEVSEVIVAYVQGQLVTSLFLGAFALGVLTLFHVPAALPLALLAAVCDALPIVGVFISTIPAVLFALTVSPVAAAAVLVLYLLYHAFENYVIIPRVYGKRLRLSTLAVIIALLIGGSLYGVAGAILVLPFVAAYPIIEQIWLRGYLSPELVADHKALERAAESGSEQAVEAVLRGEVHPAERNRRI
jgi:predicted PurR-regulated permease PerM